MMMRIFLCTLCVAVFVFQGSVIFSDLPAWHRLGAVVAAVFTAGLFEFIRRGRRV